MTQRKTVKMIDAEVKGLRQELLRLKDEVAGLKLAVVLHIAKTRSKEDES